MKWEMEIEEVEAVLEKIWDLHDKLSDAIHSISRTHYLNCVKSVDEFASRGFDKRKPLNADNHRNGFVFVKGYDDSVTIQEAKSLNAIRTALENLEDQLEFFHTVQTQQRAERDAAIARLEQSRIVLAMRLAEHQGKKYKVIEEALSFIGDVQEAGRFISPENVYGPATCPPGKNSGNHEGKRSNILIKVLLSSFNFAKNSLKLDHVGGLLGNAAMVAVSMLALLHLNQVANKDKYMIDFPQNQAATYNRNMTKASRSEGFTPGGGRTTDLDVLLARG